MRRLLLSWPHSEFPRACLGVHIKAIAFFLRKQTRTFTTNLEVVKASSYNTLFLLILTRLNLPKMARQNRQAQWACESIVSKCRARNSSNRVLGRSLGGLRQANPFSVFCFHMTADAARCRYLTLLMPGKLLNPILSGFHKTGVTMISALQMRFSTSESQSSKLEEISGHIYGLRVGREYEMDQICDGLDLGLLLTKQG